MSTIFTSIVQKWRNCADAFLKGTHFYFLSFVPSQKGFITSWFLQLFYSGIKDNEDQLKVLRSFPGVAFFFFLTNLKAILNSYFIIHDMLSENYPRQSLGLDIGSLLSSRPRG
jgi:hypothetical protein